MYKIIEVIWTDGKDACGFAENVDKSYASIISELWQLDRPKYGIRVIVADKRGKELANFKYNEEEKGYRSARQFEWMC